MGRITAKLFLSKAAAPVVMLLGIALSITAGWIDYQRIVYEQQLIFHREVERIEQRVTELMNVYEAGLRGCRGLFVASKTVERDEFHSYFNSRRHALEFPGSLGIGYIQYLKRSDLKKFITDTAVDGCPGYRVYPDTQTDDLYPIKFIEPVENNLNAVGYDIGSNPDRREAADLARDTGSFTTTRMIRLVQDPQQRPAVLILLPFYRGTQSPETVEDRRKNLVGWVFMPLIIDDVMRPLCAGIDETLDFDIYDGTVENKEYQIFDRTEDPDHEARVDSIHNEIFSTSRPLPIAGRTWTLHVSAMPEFFRQWDPWQPKALGLAGCVLSIMVGMLVWVLGRQRRVAERLATEMTHVLRANQTELSKLAMVASRTHNSVIITDAQGRVEWVNEGFTRVSGYTLDEVRGRKPGSVLQGPDTNPMTVKKIHDALEAGEHVDARLLNYTKQGKPYWVDIEIKPVLDEAGRIVNFMGVGADITRQVESQRLVQESESRFRAAIDGGLSAFFLLRAVRDGTDEIVDFEFVDVNRIGLQMVNKPREQVIGKRLCELLPINRTGGFFEKYKHVAETGVPLEEEFEIETPHIKTRWLHHQVVRVGDGVAITSDDITDRKLADDRLMEERTRLANVIEGTRIGTWEWNVQTGETVFNERWAQLVGYTLKELEPCNIDTWRKMVHPGDLASCAEAISAHFDGKAEYYDSEHRMKHRDGHWVWIHDRGRVLTRDSQGQPLLMFGTHTDITERKALEQQLRSDAVTDKLTGLANRAAVHEAINKAVAANRSDNSNHYAVLFLDFDRFKIINDSLGHDVGDALLIEASNRIKSTLADTKPPASLAARLGGDEFVVVLSGLASTKEAEAYTDHLQEVLSKPYRLLGQTVHSSASIGITTSDIYHLGADEILRDADTAMYHAKGHGRARRAVFDKQMHEKVAERLALENDLRQALHRDELVLFYQPILSLESGGLVGFEALMRWKHTRRGLIPPDKFIPLAEETGLIVEMGRWAIDQAMQQLSKWQSTLALDPSVAISVNVAPRQLSDTALLDHVRSVLKRQGQSPHNLWLEVTESAFMQDLRSRSALLPQLRDMGVKLVMDDFGTGHSSLASLHEFPLKGVKIDRAFIRNLDSRVDYSAVIQAIVQLAHNLDLRITAEGVETREQLVALQSLDCDYAQGYLFAKPMPPEEVVKYFFETGQVRKSA
ncbi:MAG: EAL domain-containing protein [Phycisphaera sp.]|nr:EAL domain-containing protein [Phycisphaera sp.]